MSILGTSASFSAQGYGFGEGALGYLFIYTVTTNESNINVRSKALAAGWNGTTPLDATVIVNQNVVVSSTTTATPSLATGTLPTNSQVTVVNNGTIVGAGGAGANAPSNSGSNGGNALEISARTILVNNGIVGGGGGGGGAGGNYVLGGTTFFGGSGGGGGAGNIIGAGGTGATGATANGAFGAVGSLLEGGAGGSSISGNSVIVSLSSGTEFTSTAVYVSSLGAATYWYSINLSGTITNLGQSSTISYSGRIGLKLFASAENTANPIQRSNYVGQYFWQDFTSGNTKTTATIPATIPGVNASGQAANISTFNLVGYLWGGTGRRSNGTVYGGGYTDFAGPITASSTIWIICGGAGNRLNFQSSSREADCRGKSYQNWTDTGGGLSGVFTSDPLDGNNAPLLSPGSTAILGIAGGAGGSYSGGTSGGGGGSSGGNGSSSSKNASGGTQSAGGTSISSNGTIVRNADFMTGAVVQAGSTTAPGGGGYYGGGGTGGSGESGGGGGGSGYFSTTGSFTGQTIQATSTTPAGNTSDYYPGNSVAAGTGFAATDGDGNRGQVRLYLR